MLKGIDVSRWQGVIDWALVKPQVSFAILKATEGVYWTDPTYLVNKQGCAANGIPHGAYHFFRSNADPNAQANHFYNIAGSDIDVLVADVETNDGGDLKANLNTFVERLEDISGKAPMIYTAPAFWRAYGIHDPTWCNQYYLWIANYGVSSPAVPTGWTEWKIWQYNDKGVINGIPGNSVDLNYFHGTQAELDKLFGNGSSLPDKVRVTANILNIRKLPGGTQVGYCPFGTIFGVIGQANDTNGKRWFKVGPGSYIASWYTEDYA
jgi:GH25 family lysozyme M1 (1,4-beta-N-acetylmuramidase)